MFFPTMNNNLVLIIICIVQSSICATSIKITSNKTVINFENCGKYPWICENGIECTANNLVCDGIAHCSDKSDESIEKCIAIQCPVNMYKCLYGACIDRNSVCNGVQDCADNSDELSCAYNKLSIDVHGYCQTYEFKCASGECINMRALCNGAVDCKDSSDEHINICGIFDCGPGQFRCGYGGCINDMYKCDGKRHCADNSDETALLCWYDQENRTVANTYPTNYACILPILPENVAAYRRDLSDYEILPGENVDEFFEIFYVCRNNLLLVGNLSNLCVNGEWTNDYPECTPYCTAPKDISFKVICEHNQKSIQCEQPLLPNTILRVYCEPGYHKVKGKRSTYSLKCKNDGEWDSYAFHCEPTCGIFDSPNGIPLIVGGERVNITKVPWHVGIYSDLVAKHELTQICGGTIINAKTVITAAHCFWNAPTKKCHSNGHYVVGIGKYYRDFAKKEPLPTQMLNVTKIIYKNEYKDQPGLFYADIALLILSDYIVFSWYVKPICMDFNSPYNEKWIGKVAGWGLVESGGLSSPQLKIIDLPAIDLNECRSEATLDFLPFIRDDTICAGYKTGFSVCVGDSGGGLIYPKSIGYGKKLNYLRGIVSISENKQGSCNNEKYAVFTNIQFYQNMILNYMPLPNVCQLNLNNHNGYVILMDETLQAQTYGRTKNLVKEFTRISYKCQSESTSIVGNATNVCIEGKWLNPEPQCVRTCSALDDNSVIAQCEYENNVVNCYDSILPGTIAKIKCNEGYKKPRSDHVYESYMCGDDGEWDIQPHRCQQICGLVEQNGKNDSSKTLMEIPWHVDVYSNKNLTNRYYHICSGSIISARMILTSAYCLWNAHTNELFGKSNVVVSIGKFKRKFKEEKPIDSQIISVAEYYYSKNYKRYSHNYSDIAILVLAKPIIFNKFIRPICLPMEKDIFLLGSKSNMATWVLTDSQKIYINSSLKLQSLSMELIPDQYCRQMLPSKLRKSFTKHTICAGYKNLAGRCDTNIGGALVVQVKEGKQTVHYLSGIIGNCETDDNEKEPVVQKFTNIIFSIPMIKEFMPAPNMCKIGKLPNKLMADPYNASNSVSATKYYTSIAYICEPSLMLVGNDTNICVNGEWINKVPDCTKFCSTSQFSHLSIQMTCKYRNATISCEQNVPATTIVTVSCKPGFRKPKRIVHDTLECDVNAKWDYYAYVCEPICGIESPSIVYANQTIRNVPWNVGIYNNIYSEGHLYSYGCSGTILNPKIIVSTILCFWNGIDNSLYEASRFLVGAGKYFKEFDASEPFTTQFIGVSVIHDTLDFSKFRRFSGITFLILTQEIIFTPFIVPICTDDLLWPYLDNQVPAGIPGKLATFNERRQVGPFKIIENTANTIEYKTIDYESCINKSLADKICLTIPKDICRIDVGSGLSFKIITKFNETKHYLHGLVPTLITDCKSDILIVTDIRFYFSNIGSLSTLLVDESLEFNRLKLRN